MALTTYAELKTSIADYLVRTDLTSVIPDFITLAEAKFNRVFRTRDMLTRNTSFSIDAEFVTLPTDYREMKRFVLTGTNPVTVMEYLTPERLDDKKAEFGSATGAPIYYTIIGTKIQVAKSPDQTYTAELSYFASLTALSSAVNWLYTKHPDVYLYGALLEASPYLKDDPRIPVWGGLLDAAVEAVKLEDERAVHSGGTLRMQPRSAIG